VNREEVEKFGSFGNSWWDEKSTDNGMGALHKLNSVRVPFIESRSGGLKGKTLVDVGCGGGVLAEALARLGGHVTAIDPSPENIDIAKKHAVGDPLTSGIKYEALTAEQLKGVYLW